jgi:hypothetical protein
MMRNLFEVQWRGRCSRTLLVLTCLSTVAALAQPYTIDWSTIDGGGGTSTGGSFSLSGSIGQPDAGTSSGGPFTLQGGFWSVIDAVQTEGAPILSLAWTPTNAVVLSWPLVDTNWRLQSTANLTAGEWVEIPGPYGATTTNRFLADPITPGNRFYRLQKP